VKSEAAHLSPLLAILTLALAVAAVLGVYLIGGDRLFILAAVFIGGLVLAGLIAASALPIRAWRKNDSPPVVEKHVYHEGRQIIRERVIDGRQPTAPEVRLLQLPAQASAMGVFPELLRAAYQAGALQPPAARAEQPMAAEPGEPDPDAWSGDITA
jgi:hypothetical protein